MNGRPRLPAYVSPHDPACAVVWCAYCRVWHSHGTAGEPLPEPGQSMGHRVAHCHVPGSAWRETGYELVFAGERLEAD